MADNPFLKYVTPDPASQAPPPAGGVNPFMKYVPQQTAPEKPSVAEDVAKTVPAGLARGTAGLLGMPADVMNLVDRGWQNAVGWVLERTGAMTPEQVEGAKQPLPGLEDNHTRMGLPTSKLLVDATEKAIGPLYKPQTTAGEYANTAAEFAPGMVLGTGNLIQRGAQALVPAVTSETAGQVTRRIAPEHEGKARLLGALGGAVGTAVAQSPRGAANVMRESLQGVTEQELDDAYRLMQDAANLPGGGVTLTLDEALNQVTDGRMTRLSQVSRVVTNSGGGGGETMARLYSQRSQQVAQAGQAAVDGIAPRPYPAEQAAQRGVDAAEGALRTVRQERADITRPFYQNAARDTVPASEVQAILQRLDDAIARAPTPELADAARQLRGQLILHPAVPGTPATRTAVTDPRTGRVIRYDTTSATPGAPEVPRTNVGELDTVYGQARDDFMGPRGLNETGSQARARNAAGQAIAPLNDALEAASPNLQQGRAAHQQVTNNLVRPVEQGPVGRIADMDPGTANASANMGRELAAPGVDRYHGVVQQSVRRMVRQDPRAAETLARDYIGDVFNQATGDLQGGANQYGGAGFRAALVGDAASLRNIQAVVTSLPQGQQRWAGFQRFLEAMEATGFKPVKGSDTAFNQVIGQQLAERGAVSAAIEGAVGAAAGSAVGGGAGGFAGLAAGLKRSLSDRMTRYRMGSNTAEIAAILTSPQAMPILRQLANAPSGSSKAAALALRLTYIGERELQRPEAQPAR